MQAFCIFVLRTQSILEQSIFFLGEYLSNESFDLCLLLREMLLFLHQVFGGFVQFAPLGLVNMYNSGGALENVTSTGDCSEITIQIQCRGPGRFGAYSATRPEICSVDEHEVEFKHTDDGFLAFDLSHGSSQDNLRNIEILYRAS